MKPVRNEGAEETIVEELIQLDHLFPSPFRAPSRGSNWLLLFEVGPIRSCRGTFFFLLSSGIRRAALSRAKLSDLVAEPRASMPNFPRSSLLLSKYIPLFSPLPLPPSRTSKKRFVASCYKKKGKMTTSNRVFFFSRQNLLHGEHDIKSGKKSAG